MSTRDRILGEIRSNKPKPVALADVPAFAGEASVTAFRKNLETISGHSIEVPALDDIEKTIHELFPTASQIASNIISGTVAIDEHSSRVTLELVEVAVLHGDFGVAENGAVWVPETSILNRSLPFITQHLVLAIKKENIVANMHEAYMRCRAANYGTFIAGPSKTADIEQSLVIGAHGPRSLTVILY